MMRPQTQTLCQTYKSIPDRDDLIKPQPKSSFAEGQVRKRLKSANIYQGNIKVQDQLGSTAAQNNKPQMVSNKQIRKLRPAYSST